MTVVFFFKQKTAYEMRISDWSSDVCSSDLCDKVRAFHRACFSGEQELQIQRTNTPICPRHARNFGVGNTLGSLMSNGHIMCPPPEVLVSCQASLGEGPVWVTAEQALYWVEKIGRASCRERWWQEG